MYTLLKEKNHWESETWFTLIENSSSKEFIKKIVDYLDNFESTKTQKECDLFYDNDMANFEILSHYVTEGQKSFLLSTFKEEGSYTSTFKLAGNLSADKVNTTSIDDFLNSLYKRNFLK